MDFLSFREEITKYIFAEDMLQKADIILIPGNAYPQNAERAAALYRQGYAPYILPSGKYSTLVGHFAGVLDRADRYNKEYKTEWEFLKDVLVQNGVDESAILKEDQATFTWENARFSREVTDKAEIEIKKALLCCKNYHARRSLMYYQRAYPEVEFRVCPCCVDGVTKENWMNSEEGIQSVLGEVQRIVTQFSLMM